MLEFCKEIEMTARDSSLTWFLAQLKPNSARIANVNLTRQGFETFLPMEQATRPRNGKFATALRPLFPGYIFIAFDVSLGLWRTVKSTQGITRLVGFGEKPAPVPFGLISELMSRCVTNKETEPALPLMQGDQVDVIAGPFVGIVAEIESIAPDKRVWVLMDIMGRQTRVAIRREQFHANR